MHAAGPDAQEAPRLSPPVRQPIVNHWFPGELALAVDTAGEGPYEPANPRDKPSEIAMKVRNSLKSLRGRHRDNKIVRRKGRVYVINKTQPRFKARQG